ncbi:MAG: PQQ-binding-like beta-propeller repeat protein [Sulfurimonas sp.]|nr:PQQ-binding-like beta-propeller repeat protein [Sulfurimonas sp.]
MFHKTILGFLLLFTSTSLYAKYQESSVSTPMVNSYKLPYDGPTKKPNLLWKFQYTTSPIESIVTIDKDGTLYFGSNDNFVYAVDSKDGKLQWRFKTDSNVKSSVIINEDHELIFGSMDGNLYVLDKNGSLKWKYNTKCSIKATPILDNEKNILFGDGKGYFHILTPDGTLINKFKLDTAISNSAAIDEHGVLYLGLDTGGVVSFYKSGEINWSYKTKSPMVSSVVLHKNKLLVSSKDWRLYALNLDGTLQWSYRTAWYLSAAPVIGDDDRLYLGSWDWSVHALTISNGKKIWGTQPERSPAMAYFASNIVVDKNENIYAASRADTVYCFDKNGKAVWSIEIEGEDVLGGLTLHPDGSLIVPTSEGNIYLLK